SEFVKGRGRIVVEILERKHGETLLFTIGDRGGQRSFLRVRQWPGSELRRACLNLSASAAQLSQPTRGAAHGSRSAEMPGGRGFFELRAAGHVMQDFPQLVAEFINLLVPIARILRQRLI